MSNRCLMSRVMCLAVVFLTVAPTKVDASDGVAPVDPWLGATLGGLIGSTIGQGDGRRLATAVGAVMGYQLASETPSALSRHHYRRLQRRCAAAVPATYSENRGAAKAWVEGCIDREAKVQIDLEQEAYESGRHMEREQ